MPTDRKARPASAFASASGSVSPARDTAGKPPHANAGANASADGAPTTSAITGLTFAALLLAHYDAHRRELPWRQDTDPYRVWVSEVMLQQTRVETVVPYYRRWLARFPDLARLADAAEDEVLKHWEGLGYYGRARNLRRAARIVRERHAGALPSDPEALRALPGFGEYTVGAVASIAFGRRLPAVDGNVRRVLARVHDVATPSPAWLRATAAALVPADRPGDFNQALMEFGATICTPRAPRCDDCPIAVHCLAFVRGTVAQRPARTPKPELPSRHFAAALVSDAGGRLLLVRKGGRGLLAGLWAFPATEVMPGEAVEIAAARAAAAAGARLEPASGLTAGEVRHQFSHFRASYMAVRFEVGADAAEPARLEGDKKGASGSDPGLNATTPTDVGWFTPAEAAALALPVAQRKLLQVAVGVRRS